MASVQRLQAYAALPTEGEGLTLHDAPASWPDRGSVEFKNVDMTYRPGLPKVLQGVCFTVKPGEKVGVCGRTGAGKVRLMNGVRSRTDRPYTLTHSLPSSKVFLDDLQV